VRFHDEGLRGGLRQKFAAVLDYPLSIAVGKESEVPDLHKSAWRHMQDKPPDELHRIQ
jgi:hypothetical protein